MQNTEMNQNHQNNTPEWIGAGRYHPDWGLEDWKREFERSPDLWSMADMLDEHSVAQSGEFKSWDNAKQRKRHWFSEDQIGDVFLKINVTSPENTFLLHVLRLVHIESEYGVHFKLEQIREFHDTTEGLRFGKAIVPTNDNGYVCFSDYSPKSHDDTDYIHYGHSFLPEKQAVSIYNDIQNWAYRSVH